MEEYLKNSREEYERVCKWIQQLNAEYDNKEVTHSQLLEEAHEIGVAVVELCAGVVIKNYKKQEEQ